jgi:hypothetical protein
MLSASRRVLLVALVTFGAVPYGALAAPEQQANAKPIRVMLQVETEDPVDRLGTQLGTSLSPSEVRQLFSAIKGELEYTSHQLVQIDDKGEALDLIVVAEKLQVGRETYFVVSSVVTFARANGGDDVFLTHDVITEPSLALAARVVVSKLLSTELRVTLGLPIQSSPPANK